MHEDHKQTTVFDELLRLGQPPVPGSFASAYHRRMPSCPRYTLAARSLRKGRTSASTR
jgi:hypothetical protein